MLVCGSGSSDLRTSQKLCRSSWEWRKKLQYCITVDAIKHNANFFVSLYQRRRLTPFRTSDSHHVWLIWILCIHTGNSHMVILVAALQETAKVFHIRAQVGVMTNERMTLFPLFKHWAFSSEGSRRHEPMPRWPRPLHVWHLSEEAERRRLLSSCRCGLPPCSSKARRSKWGPHGQARPLWWLEVLLRWWGVSTDPRRYR